MDEKIHFMLIINGQGTNYDIYPSVLFQSHYLKSVIDFINSRNPLIAQRRTYKMKWDTNDNVLHILFLLLSRLENNFDHQNLINVTTLYLESLNMNKAPHHFFQDLYSLMELLPRLQFQRNFTDVVVQTLYNYLFLLSDLKVDDFLLFLENIMLSNLILIKYKVGLLSLSDEFISISVKYDLFPSSFYYSDNFQVKTNDKTIIYFAENKLLCGKIKDKIIHFYTQYFNDVLELGIRVPLSLIENQTIMFSDLSEICQFLNNPILNESCLFYFGIDDPQMFEISFDIDLSTHNLMSVHNRVSGRLVKDDIVLFQFRFRLLLRNINIDDIEKYNLIIKKQTCLDIQPFINYFKIEEVVNC